MPGGGPKDPPGGSPPDWFTVSATSPTDALAPAWLVEPADANALAPLVWPASAGRDDDGRLTIAGVTANDLVSRYGSPLLVLDEDEVRSRARAAAGAFHAAAERHGTTARVYYAGKAFLSVAVAQWVTSEGLCVDVCSGGELAVALAAGVDPADIGFHGNNKSVAELREAVEIGVGTIIVDSLIEIDRLDEITRETGRPARVLLRVNSGVHADTHSFLATAHEDQKFGFTIDDARRAAQRVRSTDAVELIGLHSHIGSQIFGVAGFREAAARLLDLYAELSATGPLRLLNLGGGFGIAYTTADDPTPLPELADAIIDVVAEQCAARGITVPALAFEPGRSIVGTAGVTLYTVGTTKDVTVHTADAERVRRYVSVDGGMSDNARPALYGAQYTARIASRISDADAQLVRVVGKHCESGDTVVDHEFLPGDVAPGDLIAVAATGAYCHALASNYNHVPRPPVIAVRGGTARTIVRGETMSDLLSRDLGDAGEREPATAGEGEA